MKRLNIIAQICVLSLVCGTATAECPYPGGIPPPTIDNPEAADNVLHRLAQSDCAGNEYADTTTISQTFNKLTKAPEIDKHVDSLLDALDALANFGAIRATQGVHTDEWKALFSELNDTKYRLSYALHTDTAPALKIILKDAIPSKWIDYAEVRPSTFVWAGKAIHPYAHVTCAATNLCPELNSQADMLRVTNLMARLVRYTQAPILSDQLVVARRETKRWEAYRSQGQHQYIWEVWLNGRVMEKNSCKQNKDKVFIGFCEVPTSQWIILHPDAGLRWARSAQQSSSLKPAFIIETLGYYRWDWDKDNQVTMTERYGVSLVAAYTNEPSGNKWSYGPMLHFGAGYNVAFTRSAGGTWGLLLNLNLADRYFGETQKIDGYLKCLNKPGLGQLVQGQYACNQ